MDTPMQVPSSMPSAPAPMRSGGARRVLLIIIVLIAVVGIGWYAYQYFFPKETGLTEEARQALIDHMIANQQPNGVIPEEGREKIIETMTKAQTSSGSMTEEQRQAIIESMIAANSQVN